MAGCMRGCCGAGQSHRGDDRRRHEQRCGGDPQSFWRQPCHVVRLEPGSNAGSACHRRYCAARTHAEDSTPSVPDSDLLVVGAACPDPLGAGNQLGGGEIEGGGQSPHTFVAGVALAGLDVGYPALVQPGVVSKLLLGQAEFLSAGFDGGSESALRGGGGWHPASLSVPALQLNDIAVDISADNSLRFAAMTLK
jgi:hypothetical protein